MLRANPDDLGFTRKEVISLQRLQIRSGEQTIRRITKNRPVYAGIDPYLTFIDRNVSDNVVAVTERGR